MIVRSILKQNSQGKICCKCDISSSSMGEKALHNHAAGKKNEKRFAVVLLLGVFLMQDVSWYFLVYFWYKNFGDMVYSVFHSEFC